MIHDILWLLTIVAALLTLVASEEGKGFPWTVVASVMEPLSTSSCTPSDSTMNRAEETEMTG